MATQLTLWNVAPVAKRGWDDVCLPDAYSEYFERTASCLNCRQKLRHPMHAFNHFKKFHMLPKYRFFVYRYEQWNEVPHSAYFKAKKKGFPTARTK